MRYYWCVNCGYHGDFGFYRSRGAKCQICEYDEPTEYEKEEYNEWAQKYKKFQDNSPYYKSKGKLNAFGKPFKTEEEKEKENVKNQGKQRRASSRAKRTRSKSK